MRDENSVLTDAVKTYYGETLSGSSDLKTTACCAGGAPPAHIVAALANVHDEVSTRFYGCGFPIPHALTGQTVLDLGCGTGRDVYVLAQLVGEEGRVIGIDMTEAQLDVARKTMGWHADRFGYKTANTRFVHGHIEDLRACGLDDASVDVVVSNCVVNLSTEKHRVLAEAFRVLKPGGELYLSDVVVDRRLPADVGRDPLLFAECLGGAPYVGDFLSLSRAAGFRDPRLMSRSPIAIHDDEIARKVGAARFTSATYRLFKLNNLDERCEDYGQLATYKGGITGAEHLFWLDDHHAFERGRPERVCANTAHMLRDTRFAAFFDVAGDLSTHFGEFPCLPTMAAQQHAALKTGASSSGACC